LSSTTRFTAAEISETEYSGRFACRGWFMGEEVSPRAAGVKPPGLGPCKIAGAGA
jgi:hypothetical protein